MLFKINLAGRGLEIGPLHQPVVPKRSGYTVDILDRMTTEDLKLHYADDATVDTERIEDVDYVWNGEDFATLIGERNCYDYIIASHVIEHAPDLIGFLNGCHDLLTDDGVLSLAIPDRRYCFDYLRPVSSLSQVIDSHCGRHTSPTAGMISEYVLYRSRRGERQIWEAGATDELDFQEPVSKSLQIIKAATGLPYYDAHCWCFTPNHFRVLVDDLNLLGYVGLKETCYFESEGCEFYMSLSPQGTGPAIDRLDLMKQALKEHI